MTSLRQILDEHAPLLLVDAASARIQVGMFESLDCVRWAALDQEAGTGIFRCIESLGVDLASIRSFAFAAGPGSVLGIRTAAMALRTWCVIAPRPVFSYHALEVVAQALGRPDVLVIADARRNAWAGCRLGGQARRMATGELHGPLATPAGFRHWSPLPPEVEEVPYDLAELLPRVADAALFQATDAPDAAPGDPQQYVTWNPQIHRAP